MILFTLAFTLCIGFSNKRRKRIRDPFLRVYLCEDVDQDVKCEHFVDSKSNGIHGLNRTVEEESLHMFFFNQTEKKT